MITDLDDYRQDRNARLAAWFSQEVRREAALLTAWEQAYPHGPRAWPARSLADRLPARRPSHLRSADGGAS